ncbi:hypothetical protein RHMOL_Rhmol06G0225100 [Rhododendron molle]|uniref:Uncharacterized protein n=1 Tax=Rhododendron molle TaxID=49168 RepID=A0ACC0NFE3_RHOML|nr:hypothetical protein RHMOL_Rhmol06G0225100 [Rhododendron molle]
MRSFGYKRSSIAAREEDIDGLQRSVVARLPAPKNMDSLREAFYGEGVLDIQIRDMGGNLVLLTFSSILDMNSMLEGGCQS